VLIAHLLPSAHLLSPLFPVLGGVGKGGKHEKEKKGEELTRLYFFPSFYFYPVAAERRGGGGGGGNPRKGGGEVHGEGESSSFSSVPSGTRQKGSIEEGGRKKAQCPNLSILSYYFMMSC